MVDRIEHHVQFSGGYIHSAREELTKAQEYQSKARKVENSFVTIDISLLLHTKIIKIITSLIAYGQDLHISEGKPTKC